MSLAQWKKIAESVIAKNAWWTYRKDDCILPKGQHGEYHYVHTHGSSMIVPILANGKIVLVNQYRYLRNMESLEFPCGGVKAGESYDQTAVQELQEEAGFVARSWKIAGEFNPYNGVTDEMCRVFIAGDLQPIAPKPDETEEFEIVSLSADDIDAKIISGVMWDGMSIAAWTIARPFIDIRQ